MRETPIPKRQSNPSKTFSKRVWDDNDYADIVFDGIEESLRHDSIEYKVEAAQPEPEVKANSDIRSVASDICDVFENYLDENGVCIVCNDADEEQDRKANESGAMLYGMEYWHLVEDVEFRVNHINTQYKLFTVFDIMEAFDKLLISKKLGDFVPSGETRYRLYEKNPELSAFYQGGIVMSTKGWNSLKPITAP